MRSIPLEAASLRSLAPGTVAAACSGHLWRAGRTERRAPRKPLAAEPETTGPTRRGVAFSVFEVDPPIPLNLAEADKIELVLERARLVRCNPEMAWLCGYASVDEVEGATLGELLGRPGAEYLEEFFEHDLLHEGWTEERGSDGQTHVFDQRSVGLDHHGMLYELLGTRNDRDRASAEPPQHSRSPLDLGRLILFVRGLGAEGLAVALDRMHAELESRRHALLAHEEHGAPHGIERLLTGARSLPSPDPQQLFQAAQTTVVCVLAHALEQVAQSRGPAAAAPAPGPRPTRSGSALSQLLRLLDATLPGAAERVLAEVLLHWKTKEHLARGARTGPSVLGCVARRALLSLLHGLRARRRAPRAPRAPCGSRRLGLAGLVQVLRSAA